MNDLRLFVLRLDPLGGLAHFADDQVVTEPAPYQVIEEPLRLLAVGGRALQSHVFADGAVDQLLFALLFVGFVKRVFDGFGQEFLRRRSRRSRDRPIGFAVRRELAKFAANSSSFK